jgi:hypothetical protein
MTRIPYTITPIELVQRRGWRLTRHQPRNWICLRLCPFCQGGRHADEGTFFIHRTDGNYGCKRETCAVRGTFWGLMLHAGIDPRDYIDRTQAAPQRTGRPAKPRAAAAYVYR